VRVIVRVAVCVVCVWDGTHRYLLIPYFLRALTSAGCTSLALLPQELRV
jgi:hypothetical protein